MSFGPKWLVPPIVAVFSPNAIRDVLGRNDASLRALRGPRRSPAPGGRQSVRAAQRALAPAQACAAAGVHQGQRSDVRRPHGHGGADLRRRLAPWRRGRPRRRLPDADHAVTGTFGAWHRPQRPSQRDRRAHAHGVGVHRRSRAASGPRPALAGHAGPAPRQGGGGGDARGHQRHPSGLPGRSDPRRPSGPRVARGDRPRHGPAAVRRRHLQRPADLHAGRPRHHRDRAHLRTVGARAPPGRPGPRRR